MAGNEMGGGGDGQADRTKSIRLGEIWVPNFIDEIK